MVPLTLTQEDVLNGSQGPLFYPLDESRKSYSAWNGMPIVVNHPKNAAGDYISARDPDVLNVSQIGQVFRADVKTGLAAEGWIDIELATRIEPRVIANIEQNKPGELSTGLKVDKVPAQAGASWNGKPYTHIAVNHRPDHLAFLPDSKGACSLEMGCGFLVGNEEQEKGFFSKLKTFLVNTIPGLAKADDSNPQQEVEEDGAMPMTPEQKKPYLDKIIGNCGCQSTPSPWKEEDRETLNKMADDKIIALAKAADTAKANEVLANAATKGFESDKGTHVYNATTGAWDLVPKKEEPPAVTANIAPQSVAEWRKTAPPEILAVVNFADGVMQRERANLIGKLTANMDDASKAAANAVYSAMTTPQLETLAKAMPAPAQAEVDPLANVFGGGNFNYAGAAGALPNMGTPEDVRNANLDMAPPAANWGEWSNNGLMTRESLGVR